MSSRGSPAKSLISATPFIRSSVSPSSTGTTSITKLRWTTQSCLRSHGKQRRSIGERRTTKLWNLRVPKVLEHWRISLANRQASKERIQTREVNLNVEQTLSCSRHDRSFAYGRGVHGCTSFFRGGIRYYETR